MKITLKNVQEIMALSKKSKSQLKKLNPHWAYKGNDLTKEQLIFQIVFLMDAPLN